MRVTHQVVKPNRSNDRLSSRYANPVKIALTPGPFKVRVTTRRITTRCSTRGTRRNEPSRAGLWHRLKAWWRRLALWKKVVAVGTVVFGPIMATVAVLDLSISLHDWCSQRSGYRVCSYGKPLVDVIVGVPAMIPPLPERKPCRPKPVQLAETQHKHPSSGLPRKRQERLNGTPTKRRKSQMASPRSLRPVTPLDFLKRLFPLPPGQ
jgi:hypothetical protein